MADDPGPGVPLPPRGVYVKRLRRWRFAIILIVVSAAVLAAASAGWRFARTSSAPSNGPIIIICIDTLRADHLPLYGYRNVRTPAIDALAAEGVVFDHAYAHSPQALPSTVSILSGQLPFETGVRDNVGFAMRAETRLLPQLLKRQGYASGAVVSSYMLGKETGLAHAFDFFDAGLPLEAAGDGFAVLERAGVDSAAAAQKWIASLSSPRFLLFLHINEPHAPYAPPARFAQYAPYDGEIAYADETVGRFLKWLKGKGLYDRATIVLSSDHGEGLGDHGELEHGLFLYDETIRVPLVVKLPRDVNHGHRVAAPVQQIDLVPTILDLLDVPKPAALRGRSLRAVLEGRRQVLAAQPFYAESFCARDRLGWSELRAITEGGYRFIRAPREELYDLAQDPAERTNVLGQRPETDQAMRLALDEILRGTSETAAVPIPTEERERLASLGELGIEPYGTSIGPATPLTDPKDEVAAYEKCREALRLAAQHRDAAAALIYREILRETSGLPGIWLQFGRVMERAGRTADAIEAFRHVVKLAPDEPGASFAALAAARGLLQIGRLDEANAQATAALSHAGSAHALLARIALKRSDRAEAARQAALADEADPTLHMALFVRAIALCDEGKYEDALPLLQDVARGAPVDIASIDDLHLYLADTLARLERYPEAESELREHIHLFPRSVRARTSLALLYRAERRDDDAHRVVEDLLGAVATPDAYAAAARLWTILGEKERAAATRADARERFGAEAIKTREPFNITR